MTYMYSHEFRMEKQYQNLARGMHKVYDIKQCYDSWMELSIAFDECNTAAFVLNESTYSVDGPAYRSNPHTIEYQHLDWMIKLSSPIETR